jgi:hypothetical protein
VDTYKADSSAQQKSISELEMQKRQLADDLQALDPRPFAPPFIKRFIGAA